MRIKFQNPPINEVIVGVYFDRPMMVRSEHVGVFWNSVRKEFPRIVQQPELLVPMSGPEIVFGDGFPPPRHWLIAPDDESLMQIQPNAFLFNWRKRNGKYPHYESVKQRFDSLLGQYCRFMESEFEIAAPKIRVTELTYNNVIEPGEIWSGPADTGNVVPGFAVPSLPLENAEGGGFNFVSAHRMSNDSTLQFALKTGSSVADPKKPVLVLEFRTLGNHPSIPISDTLAWFNTAHDTIGDCFLKVTNPEIQKTYWMALDV